MPARRVNGCQWNIEESLTSQSIQMKTRQSVTQSKITAAKVDLPISTEDTQLGSLFTKSSSLSFVDLESLAVGVLLHVSDFSHGIERGG